MVDGSSERSGHRLAPHVADLILEAWGPTRVACLEEAVRGLVESFAVVEGLAPTGEVAIELADAGEEALVALLEEVIYVVEVMGVVPVRVHLALLDGRVRGTFATVPVDTVEAGGALPKGVSRSGLALEAVDDGWRCRAVVDV